MEWNYSWKEEYQKGCQEKEGCKKMKKGADNEWN